MPNISNKGKSMPQSPIRKLVPYAELAYSKGKTVYHLNIGQPDIKTPKIAMDAVKIHSLDILAYTRSEGSDEYRTKIAKYYGKHDIDITKHDIIVTTGGSEALLFAFGSVMDTDDEIIIPEPFYANYNGFSTASGVKIIPVISKIEDNFALPPIEEFEKLITPKTKAILICNPGNPTGYLYSKEEIKKLAAIVKKHDLFLIADEVYREFCYDAPFTSALSFPEGKNNVVVIDSISKVFSSCGARVGFLVTRNETVLQTALKYAELRLCPPYLGQILAQACFDHGMEYVQKAKAEYQDRRKVLYQGLKQIEGLKILMASWDDPQIGDSVNASMDAGLRWFQWIHEAVLAETAGSDALDPEELCARVLKHLGFPKIPLVPIVVTSIGAHLKLLDRQDLLADRFSL